MLSTILLTTILATAPQQHDLAFDPRDDSPEYKTELNAQYPGLEKFWNTDLRGIMYRNTAKIAIAPGQIDGDICERVV
jgi:hypothetical protein